MLHPDAALRATGVRHIYLIKFMVCNSDVCRKRLSDSPGCVFALRTRIQWIHIHTSNSCVPWDFPSSPVCHRRSPEHGSISGPKSEFTIWFMFPKVITYCFLQIWTYCMFGILLTRRHIYLTNDLFYPHMNASKYSITDEPCDYHAFSFGFCLVRTVLSPLPSSSFTFLPPPSPPLIMS